MNTVSKVSAFGLALVLVFGGGWAVGRAVGPVDAPVDHNASGDHLGAEPGPGPAMAGEAALPGLAAVQNGYALVAETTQLRAGATDAYRFRIADGSGAAVTKFAVEHDKRLHLIVVRRDGTHFRHVHPEMAADGTWSVPLTPPAGGAYRVFADFRPEGGPKTTLGVDLQVAGDFQPAVASAESRAFTVDGYQVRLEGNLTAGASSTVQAIVTRNGEPVADLEPYLGAYGHLVALRGSDLAYLHVHPDGTPGDGKTAAGPAVTFAVEVPTAGRYRLFLDFQHGGQVRTAEFTVDAVAVGPGAPAATSTPGDSHGGDHGGHGG
jgi:hypothetical protein